jgi:hypothetical protein
VEQVLQQEGQVVLQVEQSPLEQALAQAQVELALALERVQAQVRVALGEAEVLALVAEMAQVEVEVQELVQALPQAAWKARLALVQEKE